MNLDRFSDLFQLSDAKLVAQLNGDVVGFVMAIFDGQSYQNGNYAWFSERLKDFVYVDRIIVSASFRDIGIGRQLYASIFAAVEKSGSQVCAEIDIQPPNPGSLRFHERAGFVQIGTRTLESGKMVGMYVRGMVSEDWIN